MVHQPATLDPTCEDEEHKEQCQEEAHSLRLPALFPVLDLPHYREPMGEAQHRKKKEDQLQDSFFYFIG